MSNKRTVWNSPSIPNKAIFCAAMTLNPKEKTVQLGIRIMNGTELASLERFCVVHFLTLQHLEAVLPGSAYTLKISGNPKTFKQWVQALKEFISKLVDDAGHVYTPPKPFTLKKGTRVLLKKYVVDDSLVRAEYIGPGRDFMFIDGYVEKYYEVQLGNGHVIEVQRSSFRVLC